MNGTPAQRGAAIVKVAEEYIGGNLAWGQVNRALSHLIHPSLDGLSIVAGGGDLLWTQLCTAINLRDEETRGPLKVAIRQDVVVNAVFVLVHGRGIKPCADCSTMLAASLDELQPACLMSDRCAHHEANPLKAPVNV